MRFILKPAGMLLLIGAIGLLIALLVRKQADPEAMALPAVTEARPVRAAPAQEGPPRGLTGSYFSNMYLDGKPVLTRKDASIQFKWGKAAPAAPLPNNHYSIRWQGKVEPIINGQHTFTVIADNGARLWVNGKLLVDLWRPAPSQKFTGESLGSDCVQEKATIELKAGEKVPIKLDYYQAGKEANILLLWSYPGQPDQVIPGERLTPEP